MSDGSPRFRPADSDGSPKKVFIGGLSYTTDDETLRRYFSPYGIVDDSVVMKDPQTRKSRGFGFITFREISSVDAVMLKEHTVDNRKVEVKRAVPKADAAPIVCSSGGSTTAQTTTTTISSSSSGSSSSSAAATSSSSNSNNSSKSSNNGISSSSTSSSAGNSNSASASLQAKPSTSTTSTTTISSAKDNKAKVSSSVSSASSAPSPSSTSIASKVSAAKSISTTAAPIVTTRASSVAAAISLSNSTSSLPTSSSKGSVATTVGKSVAKSNDKSATTAATATIASSTSASIAAATTSSTFVSTLTTPTTTITSSSSSLSTTTKLGTSGSNQKVGSASISSITTNTVATTKVVPTAGTLPGGGDGATKVVSNSSAVTVSSSTEAKLKTPLPPSTEAAVATTISAPATKKITTSAVATKLISSTAISSSSDKEVTRSLTTSTSSVTAVKATDKKGTKVPEGTAKISNILGSSSKSSGSSMSSSSSNSNIGGSSSSSISSGVKAIAPSPAPSSSSISSTQSNNVSLSDEHPRYITDEYSTRKIFVGGLHYDTRDVDFKSYFEKFGKVAFAEVMLNRETHKSRGFGFIIFEKEEYVDNVCDVAEHFIHDKQVEVKRAIPRSKISESDGETSPRSPLLAPTKDHTSDTSSSSSNPKDGSNINASSVRSTEEKVVKKEILSPRTVGVFSYAAVVKRADNSTDAADESSKELGLGLGLGSKSISDENSIHGINGNKYYLNSPLSAHGELSLEYNGEGSLKGFFDNAGIVDLGRVAAEDFSSFVINNSELSFDSSSFGNNTTSGNNSSNSSSSSANGGLFGTAGWSADVSVFSSARRLSTLSETDSVDSIFSSQSNDGSRSRSSSLLSNTFFDNQPASLSATLDFALPPLMKPSQLNQDSLSSPLSPLSISSHSSLADRSRTPPGLRGAGGEDGAMGGKLSGNAREFNPNPAFVHNAKISNNWNMPIPPVPFQLNQSYQPPLHVQQQQQQQQQGVNSSSMTGGNGYNGYNDGMGAGYNGAYVGGYNEYVQGVGVGQIGSQLPMSRHMGMQQHHHQQQQQSHYSSPSPGSSPTGEYPRQQQRQYNNQYSNSGDQRQQFPQLPGSNQQETSELDTRGPLYGGWNGNNWGSGSR